MRNGGSRMSGLEEEGFEGQPGPEGEGDDPLAGLDLAVGQQLLEDEQDRGRGAVAAGGQDLAGAGDLGVAEPEAPLDPVDNLGAARVDGPVVDVALLQAVRAKEVLHQPADTPLDQGRDPG